MNKLLVAALICLSQVMNAQTYKWGAKAGVNLARFKGDNDKLKSIPGYHAGILLDYKISKKFALQAELQYTATGAKSAVNQPNEKFKETLRLGYITIPVMLKYYPVQNLSLELGGEAGWMVSARVKYDDGAAVPPGGTCNKCTMDLMEKFETGINAGIGYDLTNHLFLETRYHLGLTDVYKNNNAVSGTFRNSVYQLSVGYKF